MCKKKNKIEHHITADCLCDKSVGTLYWRNIWGFVKDDIRWACSDSRIMGIRSQDIVVKCKNKDTYYDLMGRIEDGTIARYLDDHPEKFDIKPRDGAYYIFHTEIDGGKPYTKSFHINLKLDYYAEEK